MQQQYRPNPNPNKGRYANGSPRFGQGGNQNMQYNPSPKPSVEDMLMQMQQQLVTNQTQMQQEMIDLKKQVSNWITTQENGKFPTQPQYTTNSSGKRFVGNSSNSNPMT